MAKATKKKTVKSKTFVPMERTRALLSEIWNHWRDTLEQTPDTAKKMLTAAIKEIHHDEVAAKKQVKVKKAAIKKTVKKQIVKKAKAVARKIK